MGLSGVVRGGLWIYIGSLLSGFLGYIYWLIASRFVSPSVVGSAAAITSMQALLVSIFSLGISTGLQRFIGLSKGKNDYQQLSTYFSTSLFSTLFITILLAAAIFISFFTSSAVFNLSSFELIFVIILILLSLWSSTYTSLFNSLLRTEVTAITQTVSSILKLIIGVFLLYLGFDFVGVILGIVVAQIVTDIMLILYAKKLFREFKIQVKVQLSGLKCLLQAGLPSWIPNVLTTLGQSIGVLSVYGFLGGTETGLYYIAFAIASLVYNFPASILSLMFPVLSGMEDGRKRATSRAVRFSLVVTVPLTLALALYPYLPLSLLGREYLQASNILRILVLGAILLPITTGFVSYIYAIGKYTYVALTGLIPNICRLILYALLIPIMGATGVATAYTLGIIITLVTILPFAYDIGYRFNWTECTKTIIIPVIPAALLFTLNIHWLIGLPVLLLISLFVYARLDILTKNDLNEVSQAFLSKDRLSKIQIYVRPIIKLLYGE